MHRDRTHQLPPDGTEYHQFYRVPGNRWWRGLLVLVVAIIGYLVLSTLATLLGGVLTVLGLDGGEQYETNWLVLSISLLAVIAVLPATFLAQRWVYGLPAGWLGSVTGHLRWALVGRFAAVVAPIYVVQAAAMAFASDEVGATAFTGQTVALLAVIALLMPVQSATEEFLFRGVIARGVGSWVASRTTSLVVSALTSTVLFTFLHSSSEPAMVAFFFVFGLLASLLVWRVGGLEGSIVLHASNNAVAFFVAVLLGDALDGGTVVPPVTQALVQIAAAGLAVAAIWYLTARDRPQRVARSHTAADQAVENG